MIEQAQEEETHPLLPSGEWEGFYCYNHSPQQYEMAIELVFAEGQVSGSGIDNVASFTWKGQYELKELKIKMTKAYPTHQVFYRGDIDENGIWGTWELEQDFSQVPAHMIAAVKRALAQHLVGGFHIWPKKTAKGAAANASTNEEESEKLKELFMEEFAQN